MSPFLQHVRHVHTSMLAPPHTLPCATRQGGDKKSIQRANRHLSIILLAHRFRCGAAGSNVLRQVIHCIRQPLRVGKLHEGGDSLLNVRLLRRPGGVDVVDASLQLLLGGAQAPQKPPPDSRAVPATMMLFRCTPTSCWLERIRSPGQERNQRHSSVAVATLRAWAVSICWCASWFGRQRRTCTAAAAASARCASSDSALARTAAFSPSFTSMMPVTCCRACACCSRAGLRGAGACASWLGPAPQYEG